MSAMGGFESTKLRASQLNTNRKHALNQLPLVYWS